MAKTCVICGKPSGMYPLCTEHLKAKNEGTVVKCEECKTWHYKDKPCKCNLSVTEEASINPNQNIEIVDNYDNVIDVDDLSIPLQPGCCLTCGKESEGKFFCKSCYFKYKDKSLCLKISKCNKVEILDSEYESDRVCDDGHVVKSKSEREIDNFLFNNDYKHVYEKECYFDDGTAFHPDFYLPKQEKIEHEVYIEHWGFDESNSQYTEIKNKKMAHYKSHNITLICTYEKTDTKNIRSKLEFKLRNYKPNQVNFEE